MKDYLQDIVKHTHSLGMLTLVKVTGTDTATDLLAVGEDKSVILMASFKKPVPELVGDFGMPNLDKLNIILNIPEYAEGSKMTIRYKNGTLPEGIDFENKAGDFKNYYRFMEGNLLKSVKQTRQVNWNVEFKPTVANIQRFKFQASAHAGEVAFVPKVENSKLKFYFGNPSSHAGDFVFQDSVTGNLTKGYNWGVNTVNSILSLSGDKEMKISDEGMMSITVDSGLGVYSYLLPSLSK